MSLEGFIPTETGEGTSEAALEALREKMRRASAQIAAIKKEEGKQKKKEDELLKILLKFIKTSHKSQLISLISQVLAANIPANFILAIILLGNEDIQQEVGSLLMLQDRGVQDEQSLIFFQDDQTLPLKAKIQLDQWLKGLLLQAEEKPQKLLKTAYEVLEEKKQIRQSLIKLNVHVLQEFLTAHNLQEPPEKLAKFITFILKGILDKTEENLQNRQLLES